MTHMRHESCVTRPENLLCFFFVIISPRCSLNEMTIHVWWTDYLFIFYVDSQDRTPRDPGPENRAALKISKCFGPSFPPRLMSWTVILFN